MSDVTKEDPRTREQRLRRAAERQRLKLVKNRRRDERAWDYGGYMLIDIDTTAVVLGGTEPPEFADLDDVEDYLTSGR